MGAINYGSNNYINIGLNVSEEIDFYDIEFFYDEIKEILNNYSFYYFHITMQPGYYEGFYIDIENNFSVCFDDYAEKMEAQKEITQIKAFLLECTEAGLVQYFPGWCTGYNDYNGTKKAINEVIKKMRSEIKFIPTWIQYNRGA